MRKKIISGFAVIFSIFLLYSLGYGLSTFFADFVVENLQIGATYNFRELRNIPFMVTNNSGGTVDVVIEPMVSPERKLMPGYEHIPSLDWLQVVPNKYRLGPREKGTSDIILTVPNDPKYEGRHYQVMLNSSGLDPFAAPGNVSLALGTQTRIRFSVGTRGPDYLQQEKIRKNMMTLNLEMDPANITISEPVAIGRKINLRKEKNIKFNLINKATEAVVLNMSAVDDKSVFPLGTGEYEIGPPGFVTVKPKKVKLKGESIEKLDIFLKIPDEEKHKGKKYVFVLRAKVANIDAPIHYFSKLFVTTEK